MYSTIGGHLTPTAPVYEDMRTETPVKVTPEEPLGYLPAAVEGMEERDITQQTYDDARGPTSNVAPQAEDVLETSPKVNKERSLQEDLSRRNEITRETSREDALATTRHFFNTVNEQRNIPEVPVTSATSVSQIDPIEAEPTEPETTSPRTYLLHDYHLDPLLQLLVVLKHGYNISQRDKLKSILERMRIQ